MNSKSFNALIIPLVERVYPMVARMLGGHENAEDALQEIMIKLWKQRKSVANHPNLQALVFRMARNHCIDVYRRNQMTIQPFDSKIHDNKIRYDHDETEWNELNTIIKDLLKQLPENQAEVLMLRDLDGLEYSEISALMDLKVDNVRVLLSRARKKMGEKLLTIYNYEYREKRSAAS